jgi:hypothetical protein
VSSAVFGWTPPPWPLRSHARSSRSSTAPSRSCSSELDPDHPLMHFASRSENTFTNVSDPSSPAEADVPVRTTLPWGFLALRRFKRWAATCTVSSRPGCAASSGFLNLLTLHSAHRPSDLVSCRWRPWAFTYRGFLLDRSEHHLPVTRYPPCRFLTCVRERSSARLRGFGAAAESITLGRFYPRPQSPCLSWCCPLRGITPVGSRPRA